MKLVSKFFELIFQKINIVVSLMVFLAVGIAVAVPIFTLVLLAWEWDYIGEKNFRVSEQFEVEDYVFQRMIEISFTPEQKNQIVFVELVTPSAVSFQDTNIKQRIDKFNFNFLRYQLLKLFGQSEVTEEDIRQREFSSFIDKIPFKLSRQEEIILKISKIQLSNPEIFTPSFHARDKTLMALKDCVVKNNDNWMCKNDVPFLQGPTSYFGLSNGEWLTDYTSDFAFHPDKQFFLNDREYSWKTSWWMENQLCGELCFIGTIEHLKGKQAREIALIESLNRAIND